MCDEGAWAGISPRCGFGRIFGGVREADPALLDGRVIVDVPRPRWWRAGGSLLILLLLGLGGAVEEERLGVFGCG